MVIEHQTAIRVADMASAGRDAVSVPLRQKLRILALAIVYGFWGLAKRTFRNLLDRKSNLKKPAGGSPPLPLVDFAVGRHSFIKIQGIKLHCIEVGEKNSPPLLLLHGFPDCWLGWKAQISFLSGKYHVYAIDLKGFGDSDKPGIRLNYRLPVLIHELRSLLISLTENSVHRTVTLLAHDLGGLLSWFLLHDSPELIEKFVAVSAPHPNVFWESLHKKSTLNPAWMYSAQLPWIAENEALKDNMSLIEKCCPHLASTPTLLDAYKYVFSRHEDWTGPLNYFRNLIFWRVKENCDMINIPILLITGNNDNQISLESVVRSSEWCTNALVKIVDGVGHFPHQEAPEKFNQLLVNFLYCKKDLIPNEKLDELDLGITKGARGLVGKFIGAVNLFS